MKLVPLSDRVIVKMTEVEETTASGIILASSAKEKPTVAEVIAVGPGGMVDGHEVKMTVSVGQKVIFAKYTGTEVKLGKEEYTIVRQGDILAIVEEVEEVIYHGETAYLRRGRAQGAAARHRSARRYR